MRAITEHQGSLIHMTSNMINWTPSRHNAHRGETLEARRARARQSLAGTLSDLQRLVNRLVADGADRREIARTPAFRCGVARARAFNGERLITR
jgi:hypothetical protein